MAANDGLSQIIQDEIKNFLGDPTNLPDDLLQWLPQYLSVFPPDLQNSQLLGGTLTPVDGAPHYIAWGSGTVTWPGGSGGSNSIAVAHGLGAVPASVICTVGASSGLSNSPVIEAINLTSSSFQVACQTVDGTSPANTATTTFFWLAIA